MPNIGRLPSQEIGRFGWCFGPQWHSGDGGRGAILVMSGFNTWGLAAALFVERELKLGPFKSTRRRSRHRIGVLFLAVVVGFQADHSRRFRT